MIKKYAAIYDNTGLDSFTVSLWGPDDRVPLGWDCVAV